MRKIISKTEQEKKERIKQLVVGSILILIMFASVLGYAFQGTSDSEVKIEYNNIEFIKNGDYWVLDEKFIFRHNPYETEIFYIEGFVNLLIDYQSKPLYIYSEYKEAEMEIYKNLYNSVQRIQYACLENSTEMDCNKDWPIKTCEDNFILIQEGEFEVKQESNCLFISGTKENLTKISDEVLFKILEIKNL